MKVFVFTLLLFASLQCIAQQKQHGYAVIKGSAISFFDGDPIPAVSLTLGGFINKSLALGLGAEYSKLKDDRTPYVPVFIEASYLTNKNKIAPYMHLRLGHGIYNQEAKFGSLTSKTSGGFYLSPGVGVYFPAFRSVGAILSISYVHTGFANETTGNKTSTSMDGAALSLGFKL